MSVLQLILNRTNIKYSIKGKRIRPNPFFYALPLLITKKLLFFKAGIFFRRYHGARHISKLLSVIHKLFYVLRKKFTENSLEMCQITQCFLLKGFFKQNFNRNIRKCGKSESTKNLFSTFWVSLISKIHWILIQNIKKKYLPALNHSKVQHSLTLISCSNQIFGKPNIYTW